MPHSIKNVSPFVMYVVLFPFGQFGGVCVAVAEAEVLVDVPDPVDVELVMLAEFEVPVVELEVDVAVELWLLVVALVVTTFAPQTPLLTGAPRDDFR